MMDSLTSEHFFLMGVSLWAIWTARRKVIHEGEFQSPLSTHCFVRRFLDELSLIPKPSSGAVATVHRVSNQGWTPPGESLIKANVDVDVSRDKSTGSVAVVMRRGDGQYMESSLLFLRVYLILLLWKLWRAAKLLPWLRILLHRLVIASGCRQVVLDIAAETGGQYAAIVQEINIQRSDFQEASFTCEGRSSNMEAHSLTRFALSLDQGRHLWLLQPDDTMSIPIILNVDQ
jgi:hypothetical protein